MHGKETAVCILVSREAQFLSSAIGLDDFGLLLLGS